MLRDSVGNNFSRTFPQILTVVSGTISAISDGMQYGWTSPTIPILLSPDSPLEVTVNQADWLEFLVTIGGIFGLPATMYLVDKVGRKKSLITSLILTMLVWTTIALAPTIEYVLVARFFSGISSNMQFVAAPMYIAEIADQKIRGFLASLIYLMMLTGILIIYSLGPFVPIWIPCVIGIVINSIGLAVFVFQPESPYYLLYRNKPEEARNALRRLRNAYDIENEFNDLTAAIERQKCEKGRLQDLFIVPSNRKAMIIMIMLNSFQHMSGISVIMMNLQSILEEAGSVYLPAYAGAIVFAATMFIAAMSASVVIDNFGRKTLLCISSVMTSITLTVIAAYFTLKNSGVNIYPFTWLPFVVIIFYAASFKFGLGLVPIVMTAELFPANVKALGMTISDFSYVVFSLISLALYHSLRHKFGIQVPFYIFACYSLSAVIFTTWYIPETKGRTLEEIQMILKQESLLTRTYAKYSDPMAGDGNKTPYKNKGFIRECNKL